MPIQKHITFPWNGVDGHQGCNFINVIIYASYYLLYILIFNTRFQFFSGYQNPRFNQKGVYIQFEKELVKGDVYLTSKFFVIANLGEYRSTHHSFKLNFQLGTKVMKGYSGLVPDNVFTFIPFADCFRKILKVNLFNGYRDVNISISNFFNTHIHHIIGQRHVGYDWWPLINSPKGN